MNTHCQPSTADGASARREFPPSGQYRGSIWIKTPYIRVKVQRTGDGNVHLPGSIPLRMVWIPHPHGMICDQLGIMAMRGESFFPGKRGGPAVPENDRVPSPHQKSFHTSTTPSSRGRKGASPAQGVDSPTPPCFVLFGYLGLMGPAHGESCLSGHQRGPAAPGDDKA